MYRFLLLLLLLLIISCINGFNIIESSITRKSANLLGTDVEVALMEIEFDRDLYYHMDIVCPNYTCTPSLISGGGVGEIDCTCDYTDPLNCPKTSSGDPSCSPCPQTWINSANNDTFYYCPRSYNWTTIQVNTEYTFFEGKTIELRLKADTSICQGLRFYLSQSDPSTSFLVQTFPFTNQIRTSFENNLLQIGACPSDIGIAIWTNNTYSILITPSRSSELPISFSFIAYSASIPEPTPSSDCINIDSTHKCINDGEIVDKVTNEMEYTYYTFIVDRPMNLSFGCPVLDTPVKMFISETIKYPNSDYFTWVNNEYLTIPMQPNKDGSPKILYISIFSFFKSFYRCVVTSHSTPILRKVINNYPLGGSFLLASTPTLLASNGSSFMVGTGWSNNNPFYFVFPRQFLNPFWPLPAIIKAEDEHVNFFVGLNYTNSNPTKPNTFQAALILQKNTKKYVDFDVVANAKLIFHGELVDSIGTPLVANIELKTKDLSCNYTRLDIILNELDQLESGLFSYQEFQKVSNIRFSIDMLTLDDSWIGCTKQANSFLDTIVTNVVSNSTACIFTSSDAEFYQDPCCSSQDFFQCCIPRLISIPTTTYSGVLSNTADQCSSPECTTSVLEDYYISSSEIKQECSLTYSSFSGYQLEMFTALRNCKSIYDPIPCNNDSLCNGYSCNLYSRECEPPVTIQDYKYFTCVINQFSPKVNYYLQSRFNISYDIDDKRFVDTLIKYFISSDCSSSSGLENRKYHLYTYEDVYTQCYPSPKCYDKSCLTVHDICYDGYYIGYVYKEVSSIFYCKEIGLCSDGSCNYQMDINCKSKCQTQPSFCGYCFNNNNSKCHNFSPAIDNQVDCESTNTICLLKDGNFIQGISEDECRTSRGSCTSYCGYECQGLYTGCYLPLLSNLNDCLQHSKTSWFESLCAIPSIQSSTDCMNITNARWLNCSSKSHSECYSGPQDSQNHCEIHGIKCKNQQECETIGGQCSDEYFFTETSTPTYPNFMGKCVSKSHYLYSTDKNPSCKETLERDSPKGCFNITPHVFTQQECQKLGDAYQWWEPSLNKSQCLSHMGCQIIDKSPDNLPNNYRFNEMNQNLCTSCNGDQHHKWINMFNWVPGKWMSGIPVKPTWIKPEFIHTASFKPVFDHNMLSEVVEDAYYTHISDLLRSSSLCLMERIEDNLHSIACSCSGPGGPHCFSSSSLTLGQTNPCAKEESDFKFSFGKLMFSNSSVTQACTNVVVSQVSKQLYKSIQRETLSSNFVSYKKPDSYAIYNKNEAVIGIILTDGIKVQSQGVDKYTICFLTQSSFGELTSSYPKFDLATQETENGSSTVDNGRLAVMNANMTTIQDESYHCSEIITTGSQTSSTYFLVVRVENYQNQPRQIFDNLAIGLLYGLAGAFLFNAAWGALHLSVLIYKYFHDNEKLMLVHGLIASLTLFMIIRTIYFFLIARGTIMSSVADYILVVLPTFLYFTCFSIIIVIWYMLVKTIASHGIFQRIRSMIGAINGVLYLLFIGIVLVFHLTESKNNQNDCGGRIPLHINTTTPQRIVTIFYAVVQAVISLVIGGAFAYLGGTIYFMMKRKKVVMNEKRRSQQQRKVSTITMACSIGFILHCVFVLVLVSVEPNHIIFTFVGLMVTEIAPVFTLLYSHKKGTLSGIKDATKRFSMKDKSKSSSALSSTSLSSGSSSTSSTSSSKPHG